jgi:diguanylate cyclase
MFFRAKSVEPAAPPSKSHAPAVVDVDDVLDALAGVLRGFGEQAFDTDERAASEIKAQADSWARRVLVGGGADEGAPDGEFSRDFRGARRFVVEQRGHERTYVERSVGNMRDTVRAFAKALTSMVAEDRAADQHLGAQVGRLVSACQLNDTNALRREAEQVAVLVSDIVARRRQREKDQLAVLTERVRLLRTELNDARAKAELDPLTQLYNRAAFDAHLERVTALGLLLGAEPCILMIDVDHFKAVNDRFGHATGDRVLRAVADALVRSFLRKEDFVARYGGEEFAVIVPDSTQQGVLARTERLLKTMAETTIAPTASDQPVRVTLSVGVARLNPGEEAGGWLERADRALYAAKRAGRARVLTAESLKPAASPEG